MEKKTAELYIAYYIMASHSNKEAADKMIYETLGLTTAMTVFAHSIAARVASTDVPNDTYPCLSGGHTWIIATSHLSAPQR